MPRLILLLFLFILTNFSFGQSSLDSLRMVLPEITKIDTFGLSNTGKYLWIIDEPNVYIMDRKSMKLIHSFYKQSGYIRTVKFNYNDEYIMIPYYWLYEFDIYSLKTGNLIKRRQCGYRNLFCDFHCSKNIFLYSNSNNFDSENSIIIENLNDDYIIDSIILPKQEIKFDGMYISYMNQNKKFFYDLENRVVLKSSDHKKNSCFNNKNEVSLTKTKILIREKINPRTFFLNFYKNDSILVGVPSKYCDKKSFNICFQPHLKISFENNIESYKKIIFPSEEFPLIDSVIFSEVSNYLVVNDYPEEFKMKIPKSYKYVHESKDYNFLTKKSDMIIKDGNYLGFLYFNEKDTSSLILIMDCINSNIISVKSNVFVKKHIIRICDIAIDGKSFVYETSANDYEYYNCKNQKTTNIIDSVSNDEIKHFNQEIDTEIIDDENVILLERYIGPSSPWDYQTTTLIKLNLNDYKFEKITQNIESLICSFTCNSNSNYIFILDSRNVLTLKSLNDFKEKFSIIFLPKNNWLVKFPNSPYFMCSKDASKMIHYVSPNLKVIGFEQLDPIFNRPDIVLDSIGKYFGNNDGGMIEEYRKSWDKRIDRLGLDKEKLGKGEVAVPDAEIVDADNIAFENNEGKLTINVKASDPKYTLRRFNLYVNEVPLYGSAGISISHLKKQQWDTTLSVPLSLGENKIQVSVMNELGLENFKYPTYVNYTPVNNTIAAKTHYIGIGVNHFKDQNHELKYCVDDVSDLAAEFKGNNTVTKLFTNQNVTRENILKLKQYLRDSTTVNDKVIISCSSHGLLDDSLNFYLAMHDVDFDNPKTRGLKYEELENLLDGIPARQKLLLLDACNSGENDKTELLKQELKHKEKNMDSNHVLAARSIIVKLEEENKSNFKKMNELFVNVRNNTGSVIISAAGGQESALEAIEVNGQKIENGAFTFSVLEYLKTNEGQTDALTVNKLKQYVENRVEEITNGKQKPTSRQETMETDWIVR